MEVKGSGSGLIKILFQNFPLRTGGNQKKSSIMITWPRFGSGSCRIRAQSTATFGPVHINCDGLL
jgi:hypothetical protein